MKAARGKFLLNLIFASLFMALGFILPFVTGQVPKINQMLLPMHIPVLLCGFICGWRYGAVVGFVLPLFRGALFGFPIFYPTGISMAFELSTYGFLTGFIYSKLSEKKLPAIYVSLVFAMLVGRVVRCIAEMSVLEIGGDPFSFGTFMSVTILQSLPGMILQLILVPAAVLVIDKFAYST